MNKLFAALFVSLTVLFFACQKERSFELDGTPAQGSLQEDGGGLCLPKTVNGSYVANTALVPATNTITVDVNVATAGTYVIYTDTINGYHFRGTGNFTANGIQTVTLNGSGTPLISAPNVFTVYFDSTECDITVQVLPAGAGGPAVFTLAGAGGPCTAPVIAGNYIIGTSLGSSNTVTLSVNVTTIGTYNVTTTAVNGMTFSSGPGTFTATGAQTIVLTGSGIPSGTPGASSIPVTAGTSTCNFQITTTAGAVFSFNCASAVVNGVYQVGTALGATNTVNVDVNVTTAGPYNISTTSTNGMVFTASGTFASTGVNSIILTGSGTPLAAATSNIPTPGTPSCTFPVTVTAAATVTWQFTVGATTYQGSTSIVDFDNTSLPPAIIFGHEGTNVAGDDYILALIDIGGGINANETYNTNSITISNSGYFYFLGGGLELEATDPTQTPGVNIVIKVTSHNTTTKTIVGTFSGTAFDYTSSTIKTITNGTFTAIYP
jgi:hypothetical protein